MLTSSPRSSGYSESTKSMPTVAAEPDGIKFASRDSVAVWVERRKTSCTSVVRLKEYNAVADNSRFRNCDSPDLYPLSSYLDSPRS